MASGGCAGFSCWFFSYGVDIAKTRIQANRPRFFKPRYFDGGLYEAMKEIYVRQVFLRSFRGFGDILRDSALSLAELLEQILLDFGLGRHLRSGSI